VTERDRDIEREERERQTDRYIETERDRQTETEAETDRDREYNMCALSSFTIILQTVVYITFHTENAFILSRPRLNKKRQDC